MHCKWSKQDNYIVTEVLQLISIHTLAYVVLFSLLLFLSAASLLSRSVWFQWHSFSLPDLFSSLFYLLLLWPSSLLILSPLFFLPFLSILLQHEPYQYLIFFLSLIFLILLISGYNAVIPEPSSSLPYSRNSSRLSLCHSIIGSSSLAPLHSRPRSIACYSFRRDVLQR